MDGDLWVSETFTNETVGHIVGESGWYECYTDDRGRLFRDMQQEYGRCLSRVYVGDGLQIGWYFEKKMQYEDARPYDEGNKKWYTRGVWVSLSVTDPSEGDLVSPWQKSRWISPGN